MPPAGSQPAIFNRPYEKKDLADEQPQRVNELKILLNNIARDDRRRS